MMDIYTRVGNMGLFAAKASEGVFFLLGLIFLLALAFSKSQVILMLSFVESLV